MVERRTRIGSPLGDSKADLERALIDFLWPRSPGQTDHFERRWRLEVGVGPARLVGEGPTAALACGEIAVAVEALPQPDARATGVEWAWFVLAAMLDRDRLTQAVFEVIDPERDEDLE